jgi:predicted dehydrogenase
MELGWGIVGTGFHVRANVLPAFAEAKASRLKAVAGTTRDKAGQLTAQLPGVKAYAKLEEMLGDPEVQAVYIATPNYLHVPHGCQAIAAKKHVLMEKPMALSVDGAHKLCEAARKNEVKLGIGFHLRHHPVHQAMRELIARGDAGDIAFCSAQFALNFAWPETWWRNPLYAGPASLMGMGVHGLDLLAWLKGLEVVEVAAAARGGADGKSPNTLFSLLLTFKDGSQGLVVSSSEIARSHNDVVIYGDKLRLHADGTMQMTPPRGKLLLTDAAGTRDLNVPVTNPYAREIDAFTAHVTAGAEFHADGADGHKSVEITCAAIEAAKARRTVKVGEILRLTG